MYSNQRSRGHALRRTRAAFSRVHINAQPRARNRRETVTQHGVQGRRAKTLSRALDADSEAAPVRRAAGERGRRSIAARGERLHHLRLIRTLHPRARACSVRAREDGLAGWCGRSSCMCMCMHMYMYGSNRNKRQQRQKQRQQQQQPPSLAVARSLVHAKNATGRRRTSTTTQGLKSLCGGGLAACRPPIPPLGWLGSFFLF